MIDSGADSTSLPGPFAPLLGYERTDITVGSGRQVQGTFDTWNTELKLHAHISGAPDHTFELRPTFVPGSLDVLWGRLDFLRGWDFFASETDQAFTLVWRG